MLLLAAGCVTPEQHQASVEGLEAQVRSLEVELGRAQQSLGRLRQTEERGQMAAIAQLEELKAELDSLPRVVAELCAASTTTVTTNCEEQPPVQTIVMAADKMVVGELEHVWVDPPGASLVARIDTGAASSSLHAEEIIEFERDGDDWVRFIVIIDGRAETLERRVERYVRVYQQADVTGSRRPVVALRIALGDVQDTFEFTLADRSHLENEILLGRNFLKDVALVDVGRQFVQPPRRATTD